MGRICGKARFKPGMKCDEVMDDESGQLIEEEVPVVYTFYQVQW